MLFVAVGAMARVALEVSKILASEDIESTVIEPALIIPVPSSVVELAHDHRIVVTIEDGVRSGGVGARIRQEMREAGRRYALSELACPPSSSRTHRASRFWKRLD